MDTYVSVTEHYNITEQDLDAITRLAGFSSPGGYWAGAQEFIESAKNKRVAELSFGEMARLEKILRQVQQ